MKFQLLSPVAILIFSQGVLAGGDFGDTEIASAKQTIVHRLQIQKISDLNFGEASPGDGSKIITAGNTETNENASFQVSGEPNRAYQIILPPDNSVKMVTGSGGANREIVIKDFNSTPSRLGRLDNVGQSKIYVGATRGSIPTTQKTGEYVGQFYITVVY